MKTSRTQTGHKPGHKRVKGQIWVSAILYILIITVVMVIVLNAGIPILENLQDKTVFTRQKNSFLSLNQQIKDISEEGVGSQRVIPIEIEKGNLELKEGALKWDLLTDAKILESGHQIDLGNLYVSSNADVTAREYASNYTLENTFLRATFHKCEDRWTCTFNESGMLMDLVFKDPDTGVETAAGGQFNIDFGGATSWSDAGFSRLEDEGVSMGASSVVYYVNNTNSTVYSVVEFTMESYRDFINVKIR
ncbi:hypothetical protein ACFL0V_04170 [Nanoarchaeota archaeon]